MNTILEKTQELKTSILRLGASAREVIREVCTFEFLGLATMLLPALMASVGFFFGKTVSPVYFWSAVAILTCAAFLVGWRRGLSYLALLAACTVLTMYTFSYVVYDAENYHFPMQYLLHHGWNPVFDSTIEKFNALVVNMHFGRYHALFLPKFGELCGAIVASAFGLFVGDGFLGYVLSVCLFTMSLRFAKRFWLCGSLLGCLFAFGMTITFITNSFLDGYVDFQVYAAFCLAMLSIALYVREKGLADLVLFVVSTCICIALKTPGILCAGFIIIGMMPLLYRRISYWRAVFAIGILVAVVGASPLLTNWIQYGSPFYPSMTFNPSVAPIDITSDFTGNADALSMGYLSRICYAWVSPKLTVEAIRLLRGDSGFNPVFVVARGCEGFGLCFSFMLLTGFVSLAVSRKNLITWLCVIIFVSSNFVPLKYIGYGRYFPQILAIFPLAALNFICTTKNSWRGRNIRFFRCAFVSALAFAIVGLSGFLFVRMLSYQGRMIVQEHFRQELLNSFTSGSSVRVEPRDYRFVNVCRFKLVDVQLVESKDGDSDTVFRRDCWLPCQNSHPEVYDDLCERFPYCNLKALFYKFHWLDVFANLPHVLWDDASRVR